MLHLIDQQKPAMQVFTRVVRPRIKAVVVENVRWNILLCQKIEKARVEGNLAKNAKGINVVYRHNALLLGIEGRRSLAFVRRRIEQYLFLRVDGGRHFIGFRHRRLKKERVVFAAQAPSVENVITSFHIIWRKEFNIVNLVSLFDTAHFQHNSE